MYRMISDHYIKMETVSTIGQFAILWGMIEAKFFGKGCSSSKLGSLVVVETSDSITANADNLKTSLLARYDSVEEIMREKYLCLRESDRVFSERLERFLREDTLDAKEKTYAAICLCFRIRNNMFHGEKVFWTLNQQVELFRACCGFMNALLLDGILFVPDTDKKKQAKGK